MKLSPLEIRKQNFGKVIRGFDPDEVRTFLGLVSSEWEMLLEDARRSEAQIEELKSKIEHYQKVEEALQEALRTARENAIRTQKQAEEKAAMIVEQAEGRAQRLVEDAERKAAQIIDEAEHIRRVGAQDARERVHEAEVEKSRVGKEVKRLLDHRNETLSRLRGFLLSAMEILARYEEADPIGFIKLLPPDSSPRSAPPMESAAEEETTTIGEPVAADDRLEEAEMEALPDEVQPELVDLDEATAASEEFEATAEDVSADTEADPPQSDEEIPWPPSGWRIHEVVSSEPQQDETTEAREEGEDSEEMKKIRRILRDLN